MAASVSVTIPNNEALSSGVDLGNFSLAALEMPEGWAGTQVTFQAKAKPRDSDHPGVGDPNPEDWDNVYDSAGNEVTVTVAANRVVVDLPELAAIRYLRIRSGTSATPVNQSPSKVIRLLLKE